MLSEIDVHDTHTWHQVGKLATSLLFWSLTLSKDGRTLYAPGGLGGGHVLVIDATSLTQKRIIRGVAKNPIFVIEAP
jgi:hypothetical protein